MRMGLALLAAGLALTLLGLAVWADSAPFRAWLEGRIESAIEGATARSAEIEISTVRLAALRFEVEHFELAGSVGPAAVSVQDLVLDLRWRSLLRRRLDASELTIARLRVRADDLPRGETPTTEPPPFTPATLLSKVLVDRLRLEHGTLHYGAETARFAATLEGVSLDATRLVEPSRYRGVLQVGGGSLRLAERGPQPIQLDAKFLLEASGLEVGDLHLSLAGAEIAGSARLDFPGLPDDSRDPGADQPWRYRAALSVAAPVAELLQPGFAAGGWEGSLLASGTLEGAAGAAAFDLRLGSRDLVAGGAPIRELTGRLVGDRQRFELSDLLITTPGGEISGRAASSTPQGWLPAEGRFDVAFSEIGQICDRIRPTSLASCPTGPFQGEIALVLADASLAGLEAQIDAASRELRLGKGRPWAAEVRAGIARGTLTIERLAFVSGASHLQAEGGVVFGERLDLRGDLRLDPIGSALRDALAMASSLRTTVRGREALSSLEAMGGVLTGSIEITAPLAADGPARRGRADLRLRRGTLPGGSEAPLEGELRATLDGEMIEISRLDLHGDGLAVGASGKVGLQAAAGLEIEVSVADVGETSSWARKVAREMATSELPAVSLGWSGALQAHLRLNGLWTELDGEGAFTLDGLAARNQTLGRLSGRLVADRGDLRAEGELTGPAGARLGFDVVKIRGATPTTVHLTARRQPILPLAALAGFDLPLDGEIEGAVLLSRGVLEIRSVELLSAGGELLLHGTLGPGAPGVKLSGTGFEVDLLAANLGRPLDVAGRIDLDGFLLGTLEAPRLTASLEISEPRMFGHSVPALSGSLEADAQAVRFDLSGSAAEPSVHAVAELGLAEGALWTAAMRYPLRLDLGRLLEPAGPERRVTAEGLLDASFMLQRGDVGSLVGLASIDTAGLDADGYVLRPVAPIQIRIEGDALELDAVELRGDGTRLTLSGHGTLGDPPRFDLAAKGDVDLRLLSGWDPQLQANGSALLDLSVSGAPAELVWRGDVRIEGARVRHPEWPAALDDLRATARLSPVMWELVELEAGVGGGAVSATGSARVEGHAIREYRLEVSGKGVRMTYPEGFRSQLDADLVLAREMDRPGTLSGRLDIEQGVWDTDFEIERQVLRRVRDFESPTELEAGGFDDLVLDLEARADNGLWLRNDFADIEARADLRVRGTLRHPAPSGRIEALEGGTAIFRRVEYQVTRGSISYLGTRDPALDFEGETTVDEYDIYLTISGPLSAPVFELRSSPALPKSDIVTLLLTGRKRDELAQGGGGLSDAEAAAYLTRRLSDSVLPELQSSLGLDELRLDPVLLADQADPAARITVGKALSERATATYSRELGTDSGDIYQFRYRLSDHWAAQGTRDDDGSLAAEMRFRTRLHTSASARLRSGGSEESGPSVASVELVPGGAATEDRLRRLLGVERGDRFRRARLFDGIDAMRAWHVAHGYPEVEIDHRVEVAGDRVGVVVEVRPGRRFEVEVRGVGDKGEIEREALEAWERAVFRDEVLAAARAAVETYLEDRGYLFASVAADEMSVGDEAVRLVLAVEPGPRVRVAAIKVRGNEVVATDRIQSQMLTRPYRFFDHSYLTPSVLEEDLEAIRALYQSEGFLDATVEREISYDTSRREAMIALDIAEGDRYRLGEVSFSGNAARTAEELMRESELTRGRTFDPESQRRAETEILRGYDALGYPAATVRSRIDVHRPTRLADLTFEITEGPRWSIEAIEIRGLVRTREATVRRRIQLAVADPLSQRRLAQARHALYSTGLFRSVDYTLTPDEQSKAQRVIFELEEAPDLLLHASAGADSEEGLRVGGELAEINLFGRGVYASLSGRWGDRERRAQILVREPRLLATRASGLLSFFWEDEERESFRTRRLGFAARATRTWAEGRTSLQWGYELEDLRLFEEDFSAPGATPVETVSDLALGSFGAGFSRDSRDAPFWPTRGWFGRAEARLFDETLLSDVEFARGFGQLNYYHPVFGSGIWAAGVRLGIAEPQSTGDAIPVSERFFLGGDGSLRGFALDSVVPLGFPGDAQAARDAEVSPGGNVLFVLNQELLFPLVEPVHLLLFYDTGNLYWRLGDFDPADLRQAAGLGLRLQTPIGPLRVEYGWKLDRQQGESSGELHFSLGVPF